MLGVFVSSWFDSSAPKPRRPAFLRAGLLVFGSRHRTATVRRAGCGRAGPSSLASSPAVTAASDLFARAGEHGGQAGEAGVARGVRRGPPGAGGGLDDPLA